MDIDDDTLLFVLSLGFLVLALPTAADTKSLASRHASDDLVGLIVDLKTIMDVDVKAIAVFDAVVDLAAKFDALVADVTACAKAILAIGANIDIDALVTADIAVKVAAIISLLIVNLGVCVECLVVLIANIVVKLGVSVFASVHLGLCINILGLLGLSLQA